MVQKDKLHKYQVYEEFVFAGFAAFFFISAVLAGGLERFIGLLAGTNWILSPAVTFAVIMNFYLHGSRQLNFAIIEAAGLFNQMRIKAVLEVLVNLVVSFLFLIVFDMGIYGVLFGTTVSKIGVCIWWEILAVHKYAFSVSAFKYIIKYMKSTAATVMGCFLSYFITGSIPVRGLPGLILSGIVSAVIFTALMMLIYFKSSEFRRLLARFKKSGGV